MGLYKRTLPLPPAEWWQCCWIKCTHVCGWMDCVIHPTHAQWFVKAMMVLGWAVFTPSHSSLAHVVASPLLQWSNLDPGILFLPCPACLACTCCIDIHPFCSSKFLSVFYFGCGGVTPSLSIKWVFSIAWCNLWTSDGFWLDSKSSLEEESSSSWTGWVIFIYRYMYIYIYICFFIFAYA